jgi:hypothetical protein
MTDYMPKLRVNKMFNLRPRVTIIPDFIMDILINLRNQQRRLQIMKATLLQISTKKYSPMNSQEKCSDSKIRSAELEI